MSSFLPTLDEMLTNTHEGAFYYRIGIRHFGCSACEYESSSHKVVDAHIQEMLKYEQCPAPNAKMGEYMSYYSKEYCADCIHKEKCEIEKLKYTIALMDIFQDPSDPNIQPLFGWNEQDKIRNECLTRIAELKETTGYQP